MPKKETAETAEAKAEKASRSPPNVGPYQLELWDVGGRGDCGFRAFATAAAKRTGEVEESETAENLEKLTQLMRERITKWLWGHKKEGQNQRLMDDMSTEALARGSVPRTMDEYLAATERPARLMDQYQAMAASRTLGVDIGKWRWDHGQKKWVQLDYLFEKNDEGKTERTIVPLLVDSHFVTVNGETGGVAHSGKGDKPNGVRYRAGGKSATGKKGKATPKERSMLGWLGSTTTEAAERPQPRERAAIKAASANAAPTLSKDGWAARQRAREEERRAEPTPAPAPGRAAAAPMGGTKKRAAEERTEEAAAKKKGGSAKPRRRGCEALEAADAKQKTRGLAAGRALAGRR